MITISICKLAALIVIAIIAWEAAKGMFKLWHEGLHRAEDHK